MTAHLRGLGLDVFGIDLSPGMLAVARSAHPDVRFEVGSMLALDLPDGALAYYSTIHVPDDRLPTALAEFCRVLAPGGHLLLAFQVGDEPRRLTEVFGHAVTLEFHRRRPERMAELLDLAGFVVRSRLVREPAAGERTAQAYLVARKPSGIRPGSRRTVSRPIVAAARPAVVQRWRSARGTPHSGLTGNLSGSSQRHRPH